MAKSKIPPPAIVWLAAPFGKGIHILASPTSSAVRPDWAEPLWKGSRTEGREYALEGFVLI